jgi:transposase-like protein
LSVGKIAAHLTSEGVEPSPCLAAPKSAFAGFRFPAEVIVVAVRWYLRYNLSYRDVEELLAERGIEVDHVTLYRWVQRFTPLLADAARFARHSPGDRWHVDETYVKVNGVWRYVYRAVDQYGQVIDVLVSTRRDTHAARRFFQRALRTLKVKPTEVVTDAAATYLASRGRGSAHLVLPGRRREWCRHGRRAGVVGRRGR